MAVWQDEQSQRCGVCGMWEWQHEEGMYEADFWLCHYCRDRDRLSAKLVDGKPMHRWGKSVRFFPVARRNG